ncbi:MAG: hypothetical protein K8I27_02470 [Planctomycetes bacterium]|nr:hypothetical protein [Planctomycetota bacterium]
MQRSLAAGALALRTGDVESLRAHLGKGDGLSARAQALADRYDPQAWLLALGAIEREYDLPRAVKAMRVGDDAALAEALGFGPQALTRDVLSGGGSVYLRRANARNFYESGPQAISLLDDIHAPTLPADCVAMHVTLWGRLEGRDLRVRYGLGADGLTNLEAAPELALPAIAPLDRTRRHADVADALPRTGLAAVLNADALNDPRWYGARFVLLGHDGRVHRLLLGRDSAWGIVEHESSSMAGRLEELRDQRLGAIWRLADDALRYDSRWPRRLAGLPLPLRELYDPASGDPWGEFEPQPATGFELAESQHGDWYAAALHRGAKGRRAVAPDGRMLWIDGPD